MKSRFLQIEVLADRRLLAGDIAVPLEYAALAENSASLQPSYDEVRIRSELASAFAWHANPSIVIADQIVTVDKKSLYIVDPTQDSNDVPATQVFDKPISHVLKVDDGRLLIATTSVPDSLPLRIGTSLYLLSVSGDGEIEIVDEMNSTASLSSLLTMEGGLILANWSLAEQFAGASDEFADADIKLIGKSQRWQKNGLDFFDLSNGRLETELRVEVTGSVSAQYAGNGLVIANSASGLEIIDVFSDVTQPVSVAGLDRILSIVSANSTDPSMLSAVIKTDSEDVLINVSRGGEVLASESLSDREPGMPIVGGAPLRYQHSLLRSLYGNGVTSTVTVYPIDSSDDLGIVTESTDGLKIQRLPLPFERTGFRPAFAVGDDSIIAIRADISVLEQSGFTASSDSVEYHAFLLRRQDNGQFVATDQIRLNSVDYDASAVVSPGTVTLRSMDGRMPTGDTVVLRVESNKLVARNFSNANAALTGFADGLVTTDSGAVSFRRWAAPQVTDFVVAGSDFRYDVSGDGQLSALDALLVINHLNRSSADLALASGEDLSGSFDMNGDGQVTALDALLIINHLNRNNQIVGVGENHEKEDDELLVDSIPTLLF